MAKTVLVAGAGPVGLTMAAELARYGVAVRIIDAAPQRTDKSKALAIWARTLELLDRAGCARALIAAGNKVEVASMHAGGKTIARVPFDTLASPYRFVLMLPQSRTEAILDAHLAQFGAKVERSVQLEGFEQLPDGVRCSLRHADGRSESFEASWLIGCDGAHSTVRKTLALPFQGDTLPQSFVLADVHIAGAGLPEGELAIFWHDDGVIVFFPMGGGRYRIIADTGTEERHDPQLAEVQAIVDKRGPGGLVLADPVWLAGFSVNERKVAEYRHGRVLLAGDAAHIHSPAGGQGMNTGMHDAVNLAWKLALVDRGLAGSWLLDSYSAERSPIAAQVLRESGRMTQAAMLHSPLAQRLRNFVVHHVLGTETAQHGMSEHLSELAIHYPDSPLNSGSARGLGGPAPGERLLDARPFGAGGQPRFALMAADSTEARALLARFPALLETDLRSPPDDSGIWLVRPDGYVAAVARTGDWHVLADCLNRVSVSKAG